MVIAPARRAGDPGSIPGPGENFSPKLLIYDLPTSLFPVVIIYIICSEVDFLLAIHHIQFQTLKIAIHAKMLLFSPRLT